MDVAPRHHENIVSLLHTPLAAWISASSGLPWKDVTMRRLLAVCGEARDFRARHLCTTHVTYLLSLQKYKYLWIWSKSNNSNFNYR